MNNPIIAIFLNSHHLSAWYCMDITRINSDLMILHQWQIVSNKKKMPFYTKNSYCKSSLHLFSLQTFVNDSRVKQHPVDLKLRDNIRFGYDILYNYNSSTNHN